VKIAVVGGGSTYTPELVHGLAALGVGEVALYDADPERLEIVGGFTKRMAPALSISLHRGRGAALAGADFVIVQIRVGGQAARLADERLGLEHGLIGQETTGVGGLAKALRTIPVLLDIAERTAQLAPNALLINFTNPVSIVTEALLKQARVKAIGLCNIPISQRMEIAAELGVRPEEVELDSVGLNHLSFVRRVLVRGADVLPEIIELIAKSGKKPANLPDLDFPLELIRHLAMIPSGYLRYYFLARETVEEQRAEPRLRAEEVMAIERELLAYYADRTKTEKPASLSKRGGAFYSRAALEIIEAVAHDRGDRLVVDVRNGSAVKELPEDACVEVPCFVNAHGATPVPQRALEPEIRGLIQHVKAYEELAVRAALSRSRRDLYLALVAHPLVESASIAEKISDVLVTRLGW
jgi:6-phospho-beta-glucosidase